MQTAPRDSLVLYKGQAAVVTAGGEKPTIHTREGKEIKVRHKDVVVLHPGPIGSLAALTPCEGEMLEAWELLAGTETTLEELAELVYGDFTPATAWAAWTHVEEGLYFRGTPEQIEVRLPEDVAAEQEARDHKQREQDAWADFMARLARGRFAPEDEERLASVVALARGRGKSSRVLKELGKTQSAEHAHALLLRLSYWSDGENPHPYRFDIPEHCPDFEVPPLPAEDRVDLTHLAAYAIDDEGNQDPDDAISLEGDTLWVHVADVAALVAPDSPMDLEARGRGANSYLPERTTTMLPPALTQQLGLGLQDVSPALSVGMRLTEDGELDGEARLVLSRVRVTRMTYAEADLLLEDGPLASMAACIARFDARRKRIGAAGLELPEIKIKVTPEGDVVIRPLPRRPSRDMVTGAMLMAGEAAARFALARGLAIPYATQDPPDAERSPNDMAGMFAYRKQFKRTRMAGEPGLHAGLGLPVYTRATSPLRRYLDLVVHQQLRAHLTGGTPLDAEAVLARVGAAEAVSGQVRGAERAAVKHWTLVYLKRLPDWTGEGVLVDKRRGRGVIIVPELGLETQVTLDGDPPLNSVLRLSDPRVDLPQLSVSFKVVDTQAPVDTTGAAAL